MTSAWTPGPRSPGPSTSTRRSASCRTRTPRPPRGAVPDLVPCEIYCHSLSDRSILGPELAAGDAQTLTLFGLHLPARLFRGDNEARREEALAATLRSLNSVLAEPVEDVLLRGPDGRPCLEVRTPVDLEQDLGLPGGNIFHRSLQWPWAETPQQVGTWGVETVHERVLVCGAGARRGGGVSGIPGHNAAQAVLAGAPARPGARSVARVGQDRRHGPSAGVRAPHHRGAGHPLRPAVVHRRARARSSRWRSPRPSSRARSPRASASTAAPSRASPGSTRRTCSAKPDPSTFQVLPWRGEQPRHGADVLRHRCMPDGSAELRRPALRAQARAGQGRRPRVHLLHPPRDRVLPVRAADGRRRPPVPVDQGGYFDHVPHGTAPRLPPGRDHDARVDGHLGGVQPPRGRPGPERDRPALRRRAHHRRQHHDLPHGDQGGRARAGRLRLVHAQAVRRPPRLGHAHPPVAVRGRPQRLPRGRRAVPAEPRSGGSSSPACCGTRAEITAVTNQWVNSYKRLWGGGEAPAYVCWGHNNRSRAGPGADVQAGQGPVDPGRGPLARLGLQPLPRVRGDARRRAQGHRGGLRAARRGRGRRLGADRRRAPRAWASSRCPPTLREAIR